MCDVQMMHPLLPGFRMSAVSCCCKQGLGERAAHRSFHVGVSRSHHLIALSPHPHPPGRHPCSLREWAGRGVVWVVLYMGCLGSLTEEVTSRLPGEEPAEQYQGQSPPGRRTSMAGGDEAGVGAGVGVGVGRATAASVALTGLGKE